MGRCGYPAAMVATAYTGTCSISGVRSSARSPWPANSGGLRASAWIPGVWTFGLLDRQGKLIGNPYHYRDDRTDGMLDEAFKRLPREQIFAQTGIQFMPINTLYQLLALVINESPALQYAATFLTMPDLFNYWLTGRAACEFSNANNYSVL